LLDGGSFWRIKKGDHVLAVAGTPSAAAAAAVSLLRGASDSLIWIDDEIIDARVGFRDLIGRWACKHASRIFVSDHDRIRAAESKTRGLDIPIVLLPD
jgi:hypothetical protein